MHDEYIYTSLVEKTYWALSILYFSKALKVGQIKPNFHRNSPKSSPMKAIILSKCQFSNELFKYSFSNAFMKGKIFFFFIFTFTNRTRASHQHLLNNEKGLPFPSNILASEEKDSARLERGNFDGYLHHAVSVFARSLQ